MIVMRKIVKVFFTLMFVFTMVITSVFTTEASTNNSKKPAKATVKSTSVDNSKITVKWGKVKKATGYQIAYKTASAKKYTVKKTKKTSYVVKAKNGTDYNVKVRAYSVKNNKTYYGKWSAVKTVKGQSDHEHTWVTVVDKEAWDEPIYEEKEVWRHGNMWPDGTRCDNMSCPKKHEWDLQHCVKCHPDCPDPDPQGRCAWTILTGATYEGYEQVQTGTKHHKAITHKECTTCGKSTKTACKKHNWTTVIDTPAYVESNVIERQYDGEGNLYDEIYEYKQHEAVTHDECTTCGATK